MRLCEYDEEYRKERMKKGSFFAYFANRLPPDFTELDKICAEFEADIKAMHAEEREKKLQAALQ